MAGLLMGNLLSVGVASVALSPASVAANTSAEQTFTVPGLKAGDFVSINKPTAQAGLAIVGFRASADETVAITFGNFTAGAIVPTAAETYRIYYARRESVQAGVVY